MPATDTKFWRFEKFDAVIMQTEATMYRHPAHANLFVCECPEVRELLDGERRLATVLLRGGYVTSLVLGDKEVRLPRTYRDEANPLDFVETPSPE